MKSLRAPWRMLALMLAAKTALTSPVKRQAASRYLFSFGDSYTQTGFDITGEQPSAANPQGNPAEGTDTWSGGPNYVEYLTYKYNTSLVFSYNFGYGGATISDSIVPAVSSSIHSFEEQVEQYYEPKYSTAGGTNAPWSAEDAIFTTFFGINDIDLSYNNGSDMNTIIPELISKYFSLWDNLHGTGAANFLLVGVPPVDRSPAITGDSSQNPTALSNAINTFNGQIAAAADQWASKNSGTKVAIYDLHAYMTQVLDNPTAYGFQDATCSGAGTSNCIWWENSSLHTTSTFQNLVAQNMLSALSTLGW